MRTLRNLFKAWLPFTILTLAMALGVKALLPSGYMISAGPKSITVVLCADSLGGRQTMTIALPGQQSVPSGAEHSGKADSGCAFSVLSMAANSGADALLLAIAISFVLTLGRFAPVVAVTAASFRLLPPSQGPPRLT